jgi:PleD family two-component response regulator
MPEELIAAADSAVYASKAAGRDHASVAAESSQAR